MRWPDGKQEELRLVVAVFHDRKPREHVPITNDDDVGVAVVPMVDAIALGWPANHLCKSTTRDRSRLRSVAVRSDRR